MGRPTGILFGDAVNKASVLEILQLTRDSEGRIRHSLQEHGVNLLGRMFHGASPYDIQAADLAAARLATPLVDLSWTSVDAKSSEVLREEVRIASQAVDLLLTAFTDSETFGDGHRLSRGFSEVSRVPLVSIADDIFAWQSALTHLSGFEERLGNLAGKQLVVSWGFGSSFVRPTTAHSLVLAGLLSGANVRVAAPAEFSLMNRVRREASQLATKEGLAFEEVTGLTSALSDADMVFAANWLRLDDYNHPERHAVSARPHREWQFTRDAIPEKCIFSTEPPLEPALLTEEGMIDDSRNITSGWLARRVRVLMASILHASR